MGITVSAQVANTPQDQSVCDQGTIDGFETFDLTTNEAAILGGQNPADYTVSYYSSLIDAQNNTNALPTNYVNISNPQVVYARVTEIASGNFDVTSFNLEVVTAPQAFPFTNPLTYCDEDNDDVGYFDLNSIVLELTGGMSFVDVTFYETEAEAIQQVGAINTTVLYENINNNVDGDNNIATQTIYAVLSINGLECTTIVPVNLVVLDAPVLPSDPLIYAQCEEQPNTTDGFVLFDLTSYELTYLYTEIIAAGGNTLDYTTTYYTALIGNGDPDPISVIANPSAYQNANTPDQVIYVFVVNTNTGCRTAKAITLHVALLPTAIYTPVYVCDDDFFSDSDGVNTFNLIDLVPQITGGVTGVDVTFYTTQADAENGSGSSFINDPTAYTNTLNPDTIFSRVTNQTNGCRAIAIVKLHVNPNPTPLSTPGIEANLGNNGVMEGCESYVYGQGAVFDLTQWETQIINGEIGVSAWYYTSLNDAEAGVNQIVTPTAYTNIANPQTIYMRVTDDGTGIVPSTNGTGCFTVVSFDIALGGCELPQDNLTVETISETCIGLDNGMVQITANEAYTYEVSVSLNGNAVAISPNTFTDTITISNLASGTYYVCVTATEVDVTQCYDVYVAAVEDLVGFSGRLGDFYSLALTGSKHYNVTINGVLTEITAATTTEQVAFEYELSAEVTTVKVTTDKDCQGRFEETVLLDDTTLVIYPNPVLNELRFSSNAELLSVLIYDMTGKVVLKDTNVAQMINVGELMKGLYFIKATSGNSVYTSKFIKK
jgi:hypothetical protein